MNITSTNTSTGNNFSNQSSDLYSQAAANPKIQNFNSLLNSTNPIVPNKNNAEQNSNQNDLLKSVLQVVKLILELLVKQDGNNNNTNSPTSQPSQGKTSGGSTPAEGGSGIKWVEGSGVGGSAGKNELIPPPTKDVQTFDLGSKKLTIGSDGSADANEVAKTADSIKHLYDNSSTFRNMIDSSSDPSFAVTVGKRSDNTSWGNTLGKVFVNTNNIAPSNEDNFQALLGHEFAHASIDLGHGAEMKKIESAVAQEA